MANFNYTANVKLNMDANSAKQQLAAFQQELNKIANIPLQMTSDFGHEMENIRQAALDAMELSTHLHAATNVDTGKLDFSKFISSMSHSKKDLKAYAESLLNLGETGQDSFIGLARAVAQSEVPLRRTSKMVDQAWDSIKKTAGWQMSSSLIHGLIGQMQQAVGYAQDLDRSLNDIRIVTNASSMQMAKFAKEANTAAKSLSTTTTNYTKASLIYYQQGLSDKEVQERTATTIKMANVTGSSAEKVSSQMTAVWNNFDNGTKSLEYYADVMAKLGATTASSTDEIAEGLQKFASISETVGLSYEYATSALATVTSASRESADVVGNSFKTLFARIQGLQLGETLDDGTDLNKYSAALDKVGISVKDASGEMKDMDTILDEMGGTWKTLRRDEQMALAQTVAGVRQYTQLMTLMNNWDQFQQNVNTAKDSKGTLNQQAFIYEQSWEAASNRVRASTEGIWDSLIESDGFITALNGFSSLLNMVEALVDSLGGATGVLSLFGGLLAKTFTPHISQAIGEGLDSFSMFAKYGFNKEARRDGLIKEKEKQLEEIMGVAEADKVPEGIRNVIKDEARNSIDKDRRRRFMNAQQLELDEKYEAQVTALNDRRIKAANILKGTGYDEKDVDKARKQRGGKRANALSELDKKFFEDYGSMEQMYGATSDVLKNIRSKFRATGEQFVFSESASYQAIEKGLRDQTLTREGLGQLLNNMAKEGLTGTDLTDFLAVYNTSIEEILGGKKNPDGSREEGQVDKIRKKQAELEEQTRKQQKIQSGVEAAESAAMMVALAQSTQSLTEAFAGLSSGVSDFGDVLAAVATTALSGIEAGSTLSDSITNFTAGAKEGTMLSKLGGMAGTIGIAVSVASAIIGVVKGIIDANREKENTADEQNMEKADQAKEENQKHRELVSAVKDNAAAYEEAQKDYASGKISSDELGAIKQDFVNSAVEAQKNGGITGLTAAALAGNIQEVNRLLKDDREQQISTDSIALNQGKESAGDYLLRNTKKTGSITAISRDSKTQSVLSGLESSGILNSSNVTVSSDGRVTVNRFGMTRSADEFVKGWEDLNTILDHLTAAGVSSDDTVYKKVSEYVEENRANVEQYQKYAEDIDNLGIEDSALDKGIYDVDNITDLIQKRNELIKEQTIDKGITDPAEIKKTTEAIDTYLGTLGNITNSADGNLLYAAQGIDDLYKEYDSAAIVSGQSGMSKKEFTNQMSQLYEQYGNAVFSLNFDANFNGHSSIAALVQDQLKGLEAQSNTIALQASLDIVTNMKDTGAGGSVDTWMDIAEDIRNNTITKDGKETTVWSEIFKGTPYENLVGPDGGLNLAAIQSLPPEVYDTVMEMYNNGVNNAIYGEGGSIDTEIEANETSIEGYEKVQSSTESTYKRFLGRGMLQSGNSAYNIFDGSIVTSPEQQKNVMSQNIDTLFAYAQAIKNGEDTTALFGQLAAAGFNIETLGKLQGDTALLDNLLYGKDSQNNDYGLATAKQHTDAGAAIGNLQATNSNKEAQQKDYWSTIGIRQIKQDAAQKGIDYNEINTIAYEYQEQMGVDQMSAKYANLTDDDLKNQIEQEWRSAGRAAWTQDDVQKRLNFLRAQDEQQQQLIESTQRRAMVELESQSGIDELNQNYSALSKTLKDNVKNSTPWTQAMTKMKKSVAKILNIDDYTKISDSFIEAADAAGLLEKASKGDVEAIGELREQNLLLNKAMQDGLLKESDIEGKSYEEIAGQLNALIESAPESELANWATNLQTVFDGLEGINFGELVTGDAEFLSSLDGILAGMGAFTGDLNSLFDAAAQLGLTPELEPVDMTNTAEVAALQGQQYVVQTGDNAFEVKSDFDKNNFTSEADSTVYRITYRKNNAGGAPSSGGGGGGGGGPKKVATKRKSQTVKRYKRNDAHRQNTSVAKNSATKSKDYLYGESKIAQMEKINKLAQKEAQITADRIKESRKYLTEDRENLIKVLSKYGYEAEFDTDGFLASYEETWSKIHEKIAKLYEDNELTADEQKLEEEYNKELEELNGALEDYEDSLKQLQESIEAYEESLYEMYDNKMEQLEYRIEFNLELDNDDLEYFDFLIESLGDSADRAADAIDLMGQKTQVLLDGIPTIEEGIASILEMSNDPLQIFATGGLEGVLTAAQVEALRNNKSNLTDYMNQLLELRESALEKVISAFEEWQEKLSTSMSTIEHYSSVLEYFKNIVDLTGKEVFKMSNGFIQSMETAAIDQSMDSITGAKAQYEALVANQAKAQEELEKARARGDESSIKQWEETLKTINSELESAQDSMLSALENSLNLIAEQFESAMQRAVDSFNESIYAYGGLEGLQSDYSLIREQSDLMAADYDKIYQLSKLTRNINKTLNDSNIIAGKQKLKSLQQEINELQASGVELSKYDLENLQAKYELRLAEIELENARNNKDTVRLSKDSEGNWSYIYTTSVDKVDEAQQKYEDALYEMQNLSYQYIEEMSTSMMETSLAMMQEIQSLQIKDFDSYEAYAAEVQRIQDKYSSYLRNQENELNKSVANNADLYNQDWQNYSRITGYKISDNEAWMDNFNETTLGMLMGSDATASDFAKTIFGLSDTMANELGVSAMNYFNNMEKAFAAYGTSISQFGTHVSTTTKNISTASKTAAEDMKEMAKDFVDDFKTITDNLTSWQEEFSKQIDDMLTKIQETISKINEMIETSAKTTGDNRTPTSMIGNAEAAELLNNDSLIGGKWGTWGVDESNNITLNGSQANLIDFNARLIDEINDAMQDMFNAKTGSDARKEAEEKVKELFKDYWAFKDIVARIYDIGELKTPEYASMDTGGYTGEWGSSGKFAMLHEKELVLSADDTKNFLDALSLSKEVINSMIEMNAKQSSLALGNLSPSSVQEFAQLLEQSVSIAAEFPNATDHNEIEQAFNNLINTASQYANRHRI